MNRKLNLNGIFKLISLYRSHTILWNRNVKTFRCKKLKEKAYKEIGSEMGMSPENVKKKLSCLRITYTAERRKALSKNSSSDTEKRYIPKLLWFSEMSFLDKFIGGKTAVDDLNSMCTKNLLDSKQYVETDDETYVSPKIKKEERLYVKSTCADERSSLSANMSILGEEENYTMGSPLSVNNCIVTGNTLGNVHENEMEVQEFFGNKCRICLNENVQLDWNEILHTHGRLTYKDCYYKYTQLEYFDEDVFSTMLCRDCANSLEYIDTFISKAIDAHVKMQEKRRSVVVTATEEDDVINETHDFETVLEEPVIKTEVQTDPEEDFFQLSVEGETCSTSEKCVIPLEEIEKQSKERELKTEHEISGEWFKDEKKGPISYIQATCCSICSKVLSSKYVAIKHEKTHIKNRERNETCVHCGLKFFSKEILRLHMTTHLEGRQKKHKCEYCDKAFYHKGALNVHLRIHLGQMIQCVMCTKQFFRQFDLDKHMATHLASRIDSDIKIEQKKFVRCKDCGENVRTTSFKSHTARHMNEPLCKCSICNKEFYSRGSCAKHIKKTHDIPSGETTNFIIAYKNNRMSHLFMQQYSNEQISGE